MTLWVSVNPPENKKKTIHCTSVQRAYEIIQEHNLTTHAIKHIYVDSAMAEKLLVRMAKNGNRYYVEVLGEPTELTTKLLQALHWDIPETTTDIHTLITVLKGNHNLKQGLPNGYQKFPDILNDVALYISDKCGISYSDLYKDERAIRDIVQSAVMDYMRVTDNALSFIYDYQQTRNTGADESYAWCAALKNVYVLNALHMFVNGFTEENTKPYTRQHPFIP